MSIFENEYKNWLIDLKSKIRSAQAKATIAVNTALIEYYWDLGKMIAEKENVWGSKLIDQVAKDIKSEFPEMKGLSASNLKYCKRLFIFYQSSFGQQAIGQIGQQAVDQLQNPDRNDIKTRMIKEEITVHQLVTQIPLGHNIQIFSKSKNVNEACYYIRKTIENGWSRDTLAL